MRRWKFGEDGDDQMGIKLPGVLPTRKPGIRKLR